MSIELTGDASCPWTTRDTEVLWLSRDPDTWVRFDAERIAHVRDNREDDTRLWKTELATLAAQTGLAITVCHLPPGTSKWNKLV